MSIIKIHLYRSPTEKQQKYLLTYVPEIHSTIGHFLEFAIKALQILNCSKDDLVIENDGYILPHCLDGSVVKLMQLLTIKVKALRIIPMCWTAQKIDQQTNEKQNCIEHELVGKNHVKHVVQIHPHSDSQESTPKFSQDGLFRQNLFKKSSKQESISKKNKKNKQQDKQTQKKVSKPEPLISKSKKCKKIVQEEIEEQSPQEVESSEEEKKPKKKTKKQKQATEKKLKINKKIESFAESSSSEEIEEEQAQSEESEEESSQEELPRVTRTKKAQLQSKVESKKVNEQKPSPIYEKFVKQKVSQQPQTKKTKPFTDEQRKKPQKTPQQKPNNKKPSQIQQKQIQKEQIQKPKLVTYAQRKRIIEADDIESSDSSSSEEEKLLTKQLAKQDIPTKTSQQPQKMLPPALRNKLEQQPIKTTPKTNPTTSIPSTYSFKKHQQQQWISITKEILQKHKKSLPQGESKQTAFSQPNNLIRFKQIQLDEERFVPKTSEWIEATVESVEKDGKIRLVKVTQMGKEYRDRYETYEHNMVEFQVNRNYMTQQQKDIALAGDNSVTQQVATEKPSQIVQNPTQPAQTPSLPQQPRNSLQKFICGQVNFYFSDKNYPFDLFMQMHANKHPQKFIPIRFLLNFPKIKKILRDQTKLLTYLLEDERRNERNYEVDEEKRMVRRKVVVAPVKNTLQQDESSKQMKQEKAHQDQVVNAEPSSQIEKTTPQN